MTKARWEVTSWRAHRLVCDRGGLAWIRPERGGIWRAHVPQHPDVLRSHWQLARRAVESRLAGVVEVVR